MSFGLQRRVEGRRTASLTRKIEDHCLVLLRNGLQSSELVLLCHAAEGLTEIGRANEVLLALPARFDAASDTRTRCLCARELARAGDNSRLDVIEAILERGETADQCAAAESLFKIGRVRNDAVLRQVSCARESVLFLMINGALASHGDADSLTYIRQLLESALSEIRQIAAWLLTRLGDPSDIMPLRQCKPIERDPVASAYIDHALAVLGDADGLQALRGNFHSGNPQIRQMAADSGRLIASAIAQHEFEKLLDDVDEDVRIRAAHAILYCYAGT